MSKIFTKNNLDKQKFYTVKNDLIVFLTLSQFWTCCVSLSYVLFQMIQFVCCFCQVGNKVI